MPEHHKKITGKITHVFAHRFVVQTGGGAVLADITPKGAEQISLLPGIEVSLEGEMKPSEMKVTRLTRGDQTIHIEHKKKHEKDHAPANPAVVLASARAAGFEPLGEPRRKPKHFEVLGRKRDELTELHIELDGHIRKLKPVRADDHKWSDDLRQ